MKLKWNFAGPGNRNSSNGKQKLSAGQSRHDVDKSSFDSPTTVPRSDNRRAAEAGKSVGKRKETMTPLELKGKVSQQQSSTKVDSARVKQPVSAVQDSRPASRSSSYVSATLASLHFTVLLGF